MAEVFSLWQSFNYITILDLWVSLKVSNIDCSGTYLPVVTDPTKDATQLFIIFLVIPESVHCWYIAAVPVLNQFNKILKPKSDQDFKTLVSFAIKALILKWNCNRCLKFLHLLKAFPRWTVYNAICTLWTGRRH